MAENEKGIYRSLGTKLKILGSGDATVVAGLTNISGPSASADEIDITTLDSEGGYRSFIAGFKDA
ncbi:MAG: hypothetical protein FWE82_08935, partial [Defluviitaleaceae bacterium]|nr:hypothetical protein [Defluviitaleaceae bacterium]